MKKNIIYGIIFLLAVILAFGVILAFLPFQSIVKQKNISQEEAASLRENLKIPYETFETEDGENLFLRRWNPDTVNLSKKDKAVLIFHGITADS